LLGQIRAERQQLASLRLVPVRSPADLPAGEYDVYLTVDLHPLPVDPERDSAVPDLDNGRLRYLPAAVRNAERWIVHQGGVGCTAGQVPMWYTPNETEAWKAAGNLIPQLSRSLRGEIDRRVSAMAHPFGIVSSLTQRGVRARTELVEFRGGVAVCKVFRPGCERFFANELAAGELSSTINAVPPILEVGKNWLVTPFLSGYTSAKELCHPAGLSGSTLMPWRVASSFVDSVVQLHEAGFAHLDLHADHVLIDASGDVKIIDFDRLDRVEPGSSLHTSPMIKGYDLTDALDGVSGGPALAPFDRRFKPFLGADLDVFVSGSAARQIRHRMLFRGRALGNRIRKRVARMHAKAAATRAFD
jgi:hypothetical protein